MRQKDEEKGWIKYVIRDNSFTGVRSNLVLPESTLAKDVADRLTGMMAGADLNFICK